MYRSQFSRWFAITAPTSLVAAFVLYFAGEQIKVIFSGIPRGSIQDYYGEILEASILRFGAFFLSWLLGCFALGAIATEVSGLGRKDDESVWKNDSHQVTREHFGSLTLIALITFSALLVGIGVAQMLEFAAARAVGWSRFAPFFYVTTLVGMLVAATNASWLGLAIPLILRGNIGVWAALRRSVELSNGYEGALFLLLVESLSGPYLAWYGLHYALTILVPAALRYNGWYGWAVYVASILTSAALDPPLFLGFSLLADPDQFMPSPLPGA